MSESEKISKNTGLLFMAEGLGALSSFLIIVVIARHLGNVGLGKYSFAFAFVELFVVFSDLGLSTLMVREIAKDKAKTKKYFGNIIALKALLGIIALLLPIIIINFVKQDNDIIYTVYLASFTLAFLNFSYAFRMLFLAYERMVYEFVSKFFERFLSFILVFIMLLKGYGITSVMSMLLISAVTITLIDFIIARWKIAKIRFEFNFGFWKVLIKDSLPFWLSLMFLTLYFKIDTVMLAFMKGYAVVGWYNAAYKFIDGVSLIPFTVVAAIFPAMSRFHKTNKQYLATLYNKAFYYLLVIALPIALGTTILAKRLILFVYEEKFLESSLTLQILIWTVIFIFLNYLMGYLLNAINKQKLFTFSTVICVVINILLNLVLIPKFSYVGAAIATIITQIGNFVILYYLTSQNGFKLNFLVMMAKPILAAIAMGLILFVVIKLHILIIILVSAIVYFSVLWVLKGLGKEEIDIIKGLVKNIRNKV